MKALVLDFDGVISDSAPESFVVAILTFADLYPGSQAEAAVARLRREGVFPPTAVLADPLYQQFLPLMPLGNRGEDFGVILAIIEDGIDVPDQAAYDQVRTAKGDGFLADYHRRFYELRAELARHDPDAWRALLGPYPDFLAILRRRAADTTLAIATAKDHQSVTTLLDAYGIASLFAPGHVLDKETGVSKEAHLRHLQAVLDVDFGELCFLDDKVNHLDSVAHLGVRCALATWGYNGEREIRLARERGYLVCALGDVEAQLFGAAD